MAVMPGRRPSGGEPNSFAEYALEPNPQTKNKDVVMHCGG